MRHRHLRTWTAGAATCGSFSGPTAQVDVLLRALKRAEDAAFEAHRASKNRESFDAYRFDALIDMAQRALDGVPVDPALAAEAVADATTWATRLAPPP